MNANGCLLTAVALGCICSVRAETLGFWTFDGTSGEPVVATTNQCDTADCLTGFAIGTGGSLPVYSDDIPGRYVTSALVGGRVLAAAAKSVKFDGGSSPSVGGALRSSDLRTRLSKLDAFTVEYFFKLDASYVWRNWFAMKFGDSLSVKMADRTLTQMCTQVGAGGGSEHYKELQYTSVGAWHHAALVWRRETGTLDTYVDYQLLFSVGSVDFPALETDQPAYFGCGSNGAGEAMNGKLFGLRVSDVALGPTEMLAVANEDPAARSDPHTVFHWSFEDADAVDGADVTSADAAGDNAQPLRAHGLMQNSRLPSWSSEAIGRRQRIVRFGSGGRLRDNGRAVRFYGYSDDYPNSWAGSQLQQNAQIADAETLPPSFTYEFFLKRDLSPSAKTGGTNGQLIAARGRGPINTQEQYCDWRLLWRTNGLLFYYTTEVGDTKSVNLGKGIDDGEWHHFAFSYDEITDEVLLYLDRRQVQRLQLPAPIQRTQEYVHILGRGLNASGFNGWIDEVRLSDTVLEPEDFLRLDRRPGFVVSLDARREPAPAPVPEPAAPPASPSPFVTDGTTSGAVYALKQVVVSPDTSAQQVERLQDFAEYRTGRKCVTAGLLSNTTTDRRPSGCNAITVCGADSPLVRITFWGSAGGSNFGYPFADLADDPPRIENNPATGVTRFVKPYSNGTERCTFTWTMTPTEDGKVRVDWDTQSERVVQPWFVFAQDLYRTQTIRFGSNAYANYSDEELKAAANGKTRSFSSGDISVDAGSPATGVELKFAEASSGVTTESVSYTTYQSNLVHGLIFRANVGKGGGTSASSGSFTIDLGESMTLREGGAEPAGPVSYWASDAQEVPRRPTRNLLPNPGFEQGFRYWRDGQGGAFYQEVAPDEERYQIVVTNTPCGEGSRALRVCGKQNKAMYIRTFPLSLEKGERYTLSAWVKAPKDQQSADVCLMSASPHGGFNWTTGRTGWIANREWERKSYTFTADGGGVMVEVGGYELLFDGFQLEKGETATEWTCDPIEGQLDTVRDDDQLTKSDPLTMTYEMTGRPGLAALVDFRLENAFRENVWSNAVRVRMDADGRASVPLAFDPAVVGEGMFVLRTGYRIPGGIAWCDHHRFTRMDPADPNIATRNVFGNLYPDDRLARADRLVRRMTEWGFHSTDWGSTSDMTSPDRHKLPFIRQYDIFDWARAITSDGCFADYKNWTSVSDELAAKIEQTAYDIVRTNDARFTVWTFGNEEEYSTAAERHPAEYAKAQVACYRGVKRANPDAWVLPTHGTSGYCAARGHLQIDRYLEEALKLGVRYDAVGIHQYGNIDGGTLGARDIVEETHHLMERLAHYGYPDTTPILTTECFDITETSLPEWDTNSYDSFKAGKSGYGWNNREFVQAASVARIYLAVLHDWPRHRMANIWVDYPILDHDQMPLLLCKVPNTFATHFGDVRLTDDIRADGGIRAYVFRRGDGTGVAAVWVVNKEVENGYERGPTVTLPLPADTRAYDFTGTERRLDRTDGAVTLPLTPAPLILRAADPAALAESISIAVMKSSAKF